MDLADPTTVIVTDDTPEAEADVERARIRAARGYSPPRDGFEDYELASLAYEMELP